MAEIRLGVEVMKMRLAGQENEEEILVLSRGIDRQMFIC